MGERKYALSGQPSMQEEAEEGQENRKSPRHGCEQAMARPQMA
jgi:hypothetical protein